ncbi:MAG: hypothetical protein ACP59X_16520 [Solidesulfovibrio sp. DCME]|uniref:hypothetical protein n=1 Tax=Solidesulfovibrio sp. DCME TaxID=3447380 RepID=UPI003D0DCFF5
MVSPVVLDLSYVDTHDYKKKNNVNAIKIIEININASGDIFSEARLINQACLQFDIMSRHDTEARTHSWSRIGCLVSHVRERYDDEDYTDPNIPSWSSFCKKYFFNRIKQRRLEQCQTLYHYEKSISNLTKIYFLGIDRIVPLLNALYRNNTQGQIKNLLGQFEIDLKTKSISSQERATLSKKVDDLTKYLNTKDSVGGIAYNQDLMFCAIKVGCVFEDKDHDYMRSLGSTALIDEYLTRCIANKSSAHGDRKSHASNESFICILSKLIDTVYDYYKNPSKIHPALEIAMVDDAISKLQYLKSQMGQVNSSGS